MGTENMKTANKKHKLQNKTNHKQEPVAKVYQVRQM
jgi:hypothetical protein